MNRTVFLLTLALATLLAALGVAQGPEGAWLRVSFDHGVRPDRAPAGARVAGDAERRVVGQEGGSGAVLTAAEGLTYRLPESAGPQGSLIFAFQPLAPLDDGANHRLVSLGDVDAPGTLHLWKTGVANDLRFRAPLADGKYVEVVYPGTASWLPGVWHQILASWDPNGLSLVIDGAGSGAVKLPAGWQLTATDLTLGAKPGGGEPAVAVLDDFEVWRTPQRGNLATRAFNAYNSVERPNLDLAYQRPPRSMALDLLPPADLTFAVVSDLHVPSQGAHGQYQHGERVEELVRQLNELDVSFVLDAGDINTSFPKRPDFEACFQNAKRILADLKHPIYHAPGNHDVGNKHQFTNEPFEGWFVSLENIDYYREWFGRDYFSVDQGPLHCILLNNQVFNSLADYDAGQWAWLQEDLRSNRGKPIVAVMHNPLFWVGLDDTGTNNYETVNEPRRSEFVKLCTDNDVRAVYTGHTHHAITNLVGDTWLLTLPSTTFARNFGNNYGLPGLNVVWDPARIGFLVARLRNGRIAYHTVRTYIPTAPERVLLEGQRAPSSRFIPADTSELAAPPVGLLAPTIPRVARGVWHADNLIDGIATTKELGTVDQMTWTSDAYPGEEPAADFVEVVLASPVGAKRLEIWGRPPDSRGWPLAASVKVRESDQAAWTEIGAWDKVPEQVGRGEPQVYELAGKTVAGVRVDITAMPPMANGRRASLAEIVVRDANDRDVATTSFGATVTTASSAGGDKRTLDDNLWQAARDAGAKDLFLTPEQLPWSSFGTQVDPALVRATTMGRVQDTRLWLPITLAPPAGETDARAALGRYVSALLERCGPMVWGLVVWPQPGDALDLPAALATVRQAAGKLPVGLHVAVTDLPEPFPQVDLVLTNDASNAALQRLQAAGGAPLWVMLPAAEGSEPVARAKWLAQRAVALLGQGLRVAAPAAGTSDGPLNQTATATPCGQVVATLNTVLDGAVPGDDRAKVPAGCVAFRRPDGGLVAASADPVARGAAISVTSPGTVYAIDPLRSTLAKIADRGDVTVNLAADAAPVLLLAKGGP